MIFLHCALSISLVFLLDKLVPQTHIIYQDIHESKGETLKTKWAVSVEETYLCFGVLELNKP